MNKSAEVAIDILDFIVMCGMWVLSFIWYVASTVAHHVLVGFGFVMGAAVAGVVAILLGLWVMEKMDEVLDD